MVFDFHKMFPSKISFLTEIQTIINMSLPFVITEYRHMSNPHSITVITVHEISIQFPLGLIPKRHNRHYTLLTLNICTESRLLLSHLLKLVHNMYWVFRV